MIKKFINACLKENIEVEIDELTYESNWIKVFNSKLEKFVVSKNNTYNIKSLYNDKYLFTSVSNLNNVDQIIDSIKINSELSDNKDKSEFASDNPIQENYTKEIKYDLNSIKKFLLSLNKLKKEYPYLKSITSTFSYNKNTNILVNKSVSLKNANSFIDLGFEIVVKKGRKQETSYFGKFTNEFNETLIKNFVIDKILEANDKLNSLTPETKKTKVLFTNEVMYDIFFRFSSMFSGRGIRLKTSPLVGKLNTRVFSDKIAIIEDPNSKDMIVNRTYDAEGTICYKKEIVSKGIFKTILYNNEEAILAGTKSTGNAGGLRNCYINPGNKSTKELIKIMENGIIIDRVEGLHSGTKALTGDISVQCQGYEVKNGKKSSAIKMFVMTSNIFEILSNVIEVGNDLEFYDSKGGCPSVLSSDINISGK